MNEPQDMLPGTGSEIMPNDYPEKRQTKKKQHFKATKSDIVGTTNALYYHVFHIAFHLEQEILTTGCSEMDSEHLVF